MDNTKNKDIYSILGVNPTHKSRHAYSDQSQSFGNSNSIDEELINDPNAPSGNIFDNYSNYPKDPENYWPQFRVMTWLGIITVVGFLGIIGWHQLDLDLKLFSHKAEKAYEYIDEAVYDKEEYAGATNSLPETTTHFKGIIDNKYSVGLKLNFKSRIGEYYYDRIGSSKNNMRLNLTNIQKMDGKYYFTMIEYNPSGKKTGEWKGSYSNGQLTGTGEYLGKYMPFELQECSSYETDF